MKQSDVIKKLKANYPSIHIKPGDNYYWSPAERTVFFLQNNESIEGIWALLHETGHAILGHEQYFTDIELLQMEVEAWDQAQQLTGVLNLGESIHEDHIQDCLDSYRDWLHKRSLCPDCHLSGIQTTTATYTCVFCHRTWKVSADRFCRPYRKKLASFR